MCKNISYHTDDSNMCLSLNRLCTKLLIFDSHDSVDSFGLLATVYVTNVDTKA